MDKQFDFQESEQKIYSKWLDANAFAPKSDNDPDFKGEVYSMIMPPPNITGQLHLGHTLNDTIQDILIRYKRMKGFDTLWIPGTDHASIATEVKIIEALKKEGISKNDLGRDGFIQKAWEWNEKYGGKIKEQIKRVGCSCDWSRCAFTMDEPRQKAVAYAFKTLYDEGLIYRGERIINWCPTCHTALSDAEVEHEDESSHLWHIRYPFVDGSGYLVVATTRPETMLGDTAVAVNPNDERYTNAISKMLQLPLTNRQIPVIADEYVTSDFGTGAVKITPAHDVNDFEVGQRHNLPIIKVIDEDCKMNENAGKYAGLIQEECRELIIQDLTASNLIEKIEDHIVSRGHCYRCHSPSEQIISTQWFMDMKELAQGGIEAVKSGELVIFPEKYAKIYLHWLENIKDWCISRQLWWGHRIPVYTCEDCNNIMCEIDAPTRCTKCGSTHITQDNDVLDTWFSSGLWAMTTIGYTYDQEEFNRFFPTTTLSTAGDIIFFWVARMVMMTQKFVGRLPFTKVLIHGLVRDIQGKKMSKSSSNGVDPIEMIGKYGADALRFSLLIGNGTGNDFRFSEDKIIEDRKFINKVWNSGKYVLLCRENVNMQLSANPTLSIYDKWIEYKLNEALKNIDKLLENNDVCLAVKTMYDFVWGDFCDYYIEFTKPFVYNENYDIKINAVTNLYNIYNKVLKLIHPVIPFITEAINMEFTNEMIITSEYPEICDDFEFTDSYETVEKIISLIQSIREARLSLGIAVSKKMALQVVLSKLTNDKQSKLILELAEPVLNKMVNISHIEYVNDINDSMIGFVTDMGELFFNKNEAIDTEKEIEKANQEIKKIDLFIQSLSTKLNNPSFTNKAPKAVVELEQSRLGEWISAKNILLDKISRLQN